MNPNTTATSPIVRRLPLDTLRVDAAAQVRDRVHDDVIRDYADKMRGGVQFPPVIAYLDGETHWLADGRHRLEGARLAGLSAIEAEVRPGGFREALLFAAGANAAHGLRRSNADKRKAVALLLTDAEWGQWSSREIARRCGVSDPFVSRVRKGLGPSANGTQMPTRKVNRRGKTYGMDTSGLTSRDERERGPADEPVAPAETWPNGNAKDEHTDSQSAELPASAAPAPAVAQTETATQVKLSPELVPVKPAATVSTFKKAIETTIVIPQSAAEVTAREIVPCVPSHLVGRFAAVAVVPPATTPPHAWKMVKLAIGDLAAPDAALWLWAVDSRLADALDEVKRLGFRFQRLVSMPKTLPSPNVWLMGPSTHHCIVAVRGKAMPMPTVAESLPTFFRLVEAVCPGPKVELFARQPREGWVSLVPASGRSLGWKELASADQAAPNAA